MNKATLNTWGKILLAYLALTLLMTWPVAFSLATHVAGTGGDPWQTMWRFQEKSQPDSFRADAFGLGDARLVNISVWPWMWLHEIFGQPVAYNIVWLLTFLLSGVGMYLLVQYLTKKNMDNTISAPAFIAGVYYMFLPFHVAHANGHFGAMQIQWLPFIVLAAIHFFKGPNIWKSSILALLIGLQAWTEHHYMLWLSLCAILIALLHRKKVREYLRQGKHQAAIALFFLLTIFFVVVPYMPTIRLAATPNNTLNLGRDQLIRFSADLFSFVTPPVSHSLWGSASHTFFSASFTGNEMEATQYLGITMLLLILFFRKSIPTAAAKTWIAVAITFAIIALGPQLHVFGNVLNIHLPYDLLDQLPVFSSVRAVGRAGVMIGFSIAILIGYVLAENIRRKQNAVIITAIILLEFAFWPVPMQSTEVSELYEIVKTTTGSTIIEIPATTNYTAASRALYATKIHNKRVLGNIALERGQTDNEVQWVRQAPALRKVVHLRIKDLQENRPDFFHQDLAETFTDVLTYEDIGAIVIHTDSVTTEQLHALRSFFEGKVFLTPQEFSDGIVYTIHRDKQEAAQASDGLFYVREDGWENVRYDRSRNSEHAEIQDTANISALNTHDETQDVEFTLYIPEESEGSFTVLLDNKRIAHYGNQSERTLTQLFSIPPGKHTLTFINNGKKPLIIQDPVIIRK